MNKILVYRLFYIIKDNFILFLTMLFAIVCLHYKYFHKKTALPPVKILNYTYEDIDYNNIIMLHHGDKKIKMGLKDIVLPNSVKGDENSCEVKLFHLAKNRIRDYLLYSYKINVTNQQSAQTSNIIYGKIMFDGSDLSERLIADNLACDMRALNDMRLKACDWCALLQMQSKTN